MDGLTALHEATEKGLTSIVKLLVKNGADTDVQITDGKTALHLAVNNEKPGCV